MKLVPGRHAPAWIMSARVQERWMETAYIKANDRIGMRSLLCECFHFSSVLFLSICCLLLFQDFLSTGRGSCLCLRNCMLCKSQNIDFSSVHHDKRCLKAKLYITDTQVLPKLPSQNTKRFQLLMTGYLWAWAYLPRTNHEIRQANLQTMGGVESYYF